MLITRNAMQTKFKRASLPVLKTEPRLLIRHTRLQVVVLAERVLQTVRALLHVLAPKPTESLRRDVDQTIRAVCWFVTRSLPPHSTTKMSVLDVVDFLGYYLWRVVGDHGAGSRIVTPRCDGLSVVEDRGVGLGKDLLVVLLVFVDDREEFMSTMKCEKG